MPAKPNVFVLESHNKAALPIIESQHAHGRRVIAGSYRRHGCGFYSRCVRERVIYPEPKQSPEQCRDFLLRYLRRGHVDTLLPTDDFMTDLVAKHQDEFRKYARLVVPPYSVFKAGRDKILTLQAGAKAGVPIPRTWYPHESSWDEVSRQATYPCLIKPAVSAGARGITIVQSPEELLARHEAVEADFNRCFVQEFVPQTGMQYKVDAVMVNGQEVLAAVAYRKLRYYPPTGGSSVLNEVIHDQQILDNAIRVMRHLGWHGLCDFDFIEDPRDGVVKLVEINPRYPESYRATCVAGVDMTEMIYQLGHGNVPAPQMTYRAGGLLRFLPGDIMWLLTAANRRSQLRSWFSFFAPNLQYQVLSARDPGPMIGYLIENLVIAMNRTQRSERFRFAQARRRGT